MSAFRNSSEDGNRKVLFSSRLQKIIAIILLVYVFSSGNIFTTGTENNPLNLLVNDYIEMRDLRENKTATSIMYGSKEDIIKRGDAVLNLPPDIFILNKWTKNNPSSLPGNLMTIRTFTQAAEAARNAAIAFTVTGEEKYAEKGVLIVKSALLNPGSRNVLFPADSIITSDKGRPGLLDLPAPEALEGTLSLIMMTDAIKLLNQSNAMSENTVEAWQNFCFKYTKWLHESTFGKELVAKNDIYGNMAKVRLAVCADCGGRTELAVTTLNTFPVMLKKQLAPSKKGKLQLQNYLNNIAPASKTPLLAAMENTEALFIAARLGVSQETKIDLYNFKTKKGFGLDSCADCILPYISEIETRKPQEKDATLFNGINKKDLRNFADSLHLADRYMKNHRYEIHGKIIFPDEVDVY